MIDKKENQQLSEIDICDLYITPAIKEAGWDQTQQIRREVTLTPGPIVVRGNVSARNKKKKKFADYVLSWEPGIPIAVVEAKDNKHTVSHGMQQALGYAEILEVPSAFSSNGDAFASHNKVPAPGEPIEVELPLESFPAPATLWQWYKTARGIEDPAESLFTQPYHTDGSGKEPRYYQVEADNRAVEAVARGQNRVFLVRANCWMPKHAFWRLPWKTNGSVPNCQRAMSGTFQIHRSGSLQWRDATILLKLRTITHVARNPA